MSSAPSKSIKEEVTRLSQLSCMRLFASHGVPLSNYHTHFLDVPSISVFYVFTYGNLTFYIQILIGGKGVWFFCNFNSFP